MAMLISVSSKNSTKIVASWLVCREPDRFVCTHYLIIKHIDFYLNDRACPKGAKSIT